MPKLMTKADSNRTPRVAHFREALLAISTGLIVAFSLPWVVPTKLYRHSIFVWMDPSTNREFSIRVFDANPVVIIPAVEFVANTHPVMSDYYTFHLFDEDLRDKYTLGLTATVVFTDSNETYVRPRNERNELDGDLPIVDRSDGINFFSHMVTDYFSLMGFRIADKEFADTLSDIVTFFCVPRNLSNENAIPTPHHMSSDTVFSYYRYVRGSLGDIFSPLEEYVLNSRRFGVLDMFIVWIVAWLLIRAVLFGKVVPR